MLQPFQRFGFIQEIKLQTDKGFAFVKLDTHQNAANAIVQLQGMNINGREAKVRMKNRGKMSKANVVSVIMG